MLTGRKAQNYRNISEVSIEDMIEFGIESDIISRVESESNPADIDAVTQYYKAVNTIKREKRKAFREANKSDCPICDLIKEGKIGLPEVSTGETKEPVKKTRKPRQPKPKA